MKIETGFITSGRRAHVSHSKNEKAHRNSSITDEQRGVHSEITCVAVK